MSGQAWAQMQCGEDVAEQLASKYNEVPVIVGMTNTSVMTFYGSKKTGTWTIAVRDARRPNIDCIVAVGEGWWMAEEKPKDDPA